MMTQAVKEFYEVPDQAFEKPLRIIISQRPTTSPYSARVLRNTPQLVISLQKRGFKVQVSLRHAFEAEVAFHNCNCTTDCMLLFRQHVDLRQCLHARACQPLCASCRWWSLAK